MIALIILITANIGVTAYIWYKTMYGPVMTEMPKGGDK